MFSTSRVLVPSDLVDEAQDLAASKQIHPLCMDSSSIDVVYGEKRRNPETHTSIDWEVDSHGMYTTTRRHCDCSAFNESNWCVHCAATLLFVASLDKLDPSAIHAPSIAPALQSELEDLRKSLLAESADDGLPLAQDRSSDMNAAIFEILPSI